MVDDDTDVEGERGERDVHGNGAGGAGGPVAASAVTYDLVPLELSRHKIDWLWGKVSSFPQAWDDYHAGNREAFSTVLANRNNVFVEVYRRGELEPVGMFSATNIVPKHMAEVHVVFWDRSFKGREVVAHDLLRRFVAEFGLQRIAAFVPETNRPACKFALRIGMRQEGTLRRAALYQGQYVSMMAFGMVREEVGV